MNARTGLFSTMVLAAAMVGGSSCVFWTGGGHGRDGASGDVTFFWSFGSQHLGCTFVSDVTEVTIEIPGQVLENAGTYSCLNSGTAGITLADFAPGSYSFTIEGRDRSGRIVYEGSGTFVVDGSISVEVNLSPSSNARGAVYLSWTLAGRACSSDPAIVAVRVTIDQTTPLDFACHDGETQAGAQISGLTGGVHSVDLRALDSYGYAYYGASSSLTVVPGGATSQEYDLAAGGALAVRWAFFDGQTRTCAEAGVTTVYVNLIDAGNHLVYAEPGLPVACATAQGFPGWYFDFLYPGTYQVLFQARGTGDVLYSTDQQNLPTATVSQWVFPPLDGTAPFFWLSR